MKNLPLILLGAAAVIGTAIVLRRSSQSSQTPTDAELCQHISKIPGANSGEECVSRLDRLREQILQSADQETWRRFKRCAIQATTLEGLEMCMAEAGA